MVQLLGQTTQPETVDMGGKYGRVRGWIGHCEVDCNAVAHWLFEAAAVCGLGAKTAFGYGCINVEVLG